METDFCALCQAAFFCCSNTARPRDIGTAFYLHVLYGSMFIDDCAKIIPKQGPRFIDRGNEINPTPVNFRRIVQECLSVNTLLLSDASRGFNKLAFMNAGNKTMVTYVIAEYPGRVYVEGVC